MSTELSNYDPNIRWAQHTVRLTYQMWDYRLDCDVKVGGNCKGFDIIEAAVTTHADELHEQQGDFPSLQLKRPAEDGSGEDTLTCELAGEDDVEGTLRKMLVGLRIVKHEKDERKP